MRFILKLFLTLALFFGVLVALAYITGNEHLIRGMRYTYLIGRTSPEIDDRDFFPSSKIPAAVPQPWPLGSRYGKLELNEDQEQVLTDLRSAGFVIIKDDSLIFEQYWDGWTPDSVVNSFSVAKSYIGALAGIALKEGVITGLHQAVGEFIPEYASGCHSKITLWHLLTMSTGLDWRESGGGPFDEDAKGYYGHNVRRLSLGRPCRTEPGVEFDYISGATQIMAEVLESAYGRELDELVKEKIWGPLGHESDAWWGKDRADGDFKAFCCLYATNRDFARLGQLYLDSGRWKGEEIIPKDYWLTSITPAALTDGDRPNARYGYFWWLADVDGQAIHYARGFHGQYIVVLPKDRMVMVRTGKLRDEVDPDGHPYDLYKWIRIAQELAGPSSAGPHIAEERP
jgi:CubicO group peptidase (beta-lactamase class C family)